ncbi:methionyl-tRNA formyltransferase [Paenibacillus cellulosilyticus]|uniref:Methionyl-tRNA formyltransferase n=1 Tax=Paenibacillus cellulosilyticus TaxID=375489 RepID=A0A2V2YX39_9BACL|nr:methionyl-tRNA formyltransferase [Paenibacillus cellulosilyticus]PWW06213.1 methionyl-tRNA formyltransferase [Paenibacillus cellulosilyticus]QKS43025.1 methionyl-tRNA formyltransferase [Paenibacillus cellulosilyticus]
MKIVFMGTPSFAVSSLERVLEGGHEVVAVFTQPDRPKGRKRELTPPPVKAAAINHGIPVHQPERMRSEEAIKLVESLKPDLIVTAAYGQILPRAVLEVPRLGCINVHGSLLPKYRGGAPIQRSIINGERVTGVTIMYMAEGLDTGDMISRIEVPIEDTDTSGTLFEKLSIAGADLLARTLPQIEAGNVTAVPQVHEEATYAPNLTREDERIDWSRSARQLFDQVRGLSPMAGAFTLWNGEPFKVWRCVVERAESAENGAQAPGTVLSADAEGIVVQTGTGTLRLLDIQPAGKRTMPAAEWLKGARLERGQQFGGDGQ